MTLAQRLANQANLAMFQVSKPAVNETGGPAGGAAPHVSFIQKQHAQTAHGRIARDARAIDAGADDNHVAGFHVPRESPYEPLSISLMPLFLVPV